MERAQALELAAPKLGLAWRTTPLRLAVLLASVALALRCIGLATRPPWLDEAYTIWFSSRSWTNLWTAVPSYEPHPPFFYSLMKLWTAVAGSSLTALRGLSILLGVATVPVAIAAAREMEAQSPTGRSTLRIAFAGFVAACSPMLVGIDQDARPYALLVLAFSLAVLAALRLMREFAQGGAGSASSWLLLASATAVTLWAHATGLLYATCLGAVLLPGIASRPLNSARIKRAAATGIGVALLYLPCLVMIARRVGDWGTGWLGWDPGLMLELVGLYTIPHAASLLGAPVILGVFLLGKRAIEQATAGGGWTCDKAMLLLWLGPPILSAIISAAFVPIFLVRTLTPTLVPAALLLSGALARVASRPERSVLAATFCLTLPIAAVQTALRPATEPWDEVAAFLAQQVHGGDELWLYPNDTILPLEVIGGVPRAQIRQLPAAFPATGTKGVIRGGSPAVVSLTHDQAREVASDARLHNVPVVWLLTRQQAIFDPANDLPDALQHTRRPGPPHQWGYIRLQPYYRR